jgi:hypothetical protein
VIRRPSKRAVSLLASASLVAALILVPAAANAADTRSVNFSFGDFSAATAGGRTAVTVTLSNAGGQTINHLAFAGGATADGLPYNPLYVKPAGNSLPSGASYAAIFPSTGCSLTGAPPNTTNVYAGLFCDVGQLAAHTSVSYLLVINVPAVAGSYDTWLTVSWNEGWSTTGSNADYTFATGSFSVGTASCGTATASYFLPAELVNLANGGGLCVNQTASIASGAALTGNGGFASLGIDTTFTATCPAELHAKCYGATVSASVLGGIPVPGGIQWTVRWEGIKSLSGVVHFGDDYATDPTDYTLIPFKTQYKCSATLITNCWIKAEGSKGNANPLTFDATFVTTDNGRSGGYS